MLFLESRLDFNTPVKKRYRSEYRNFLKRTLLKHKKAKDVKVLCLPGHQALEIFEVYDRLGIPRGNIYCVERDAEAFKILERRRLGVHLLRGDVFDFLYGFGAFRQTKLYSPADGKEMLRFRFNKEGGVFSGSKVSAVSHEVVSVTKEEEGESGGVSIIQWCPGEATPENLASNPRYHGQKIVHIPRQVLNLSVPSEWGWEGKLTFDVINLDICGHLTDKVATSLSAMFAGRILNDRGVFGITSLASREQEYVRSFQTVALLMSGLLRASTHNELNQMGGDPYLTSFNQASGDRQGLDTAVIFLALGDEVFMGCVKALEMLRRGEIDAVTDSVKRSVVDSLLTVQSRDSAMIPVQSVRYKYNSPAVMRSAFMYFRSAQKLQREISYALPNLAYCVVSSLMKPVMEIPSPIPQAPNRSAAIDDLAKGDFKIVS